MNKWLAGDIRNLRLRLGWSGADFARFFGATPDLVAKWERNEKAPSSDDVLQLDRLSFYAESHSEQIERQPVADRYLDEMGREQIHSDTISRIIQYK